jgi:hypothetical protein
MSEKVEEVEGMNEQPEITVEEKLLENIDKLKNKNSKFYFFTMDTKGNPTAAVANIYEHVKILRELGYEAMILHEKNDYQGVGSWLGEEYANLPHTSIENQQLKVNGYDFVIIPEIFANVMEQTAGLPCKRVVLSQSYDYILEMMMPGKRWQDFGIDTVLTTSQRQGEYIQNLFGTNLKVAVAPLSIPSYFKPSTKPKKPIVAIYTRDQRDTVKIFKTFYLKHPHLKWVSFRDMRSMPREKFAESLSECCLAIWVDDISGFGTFPLEAMKCDVPVLGKVPTMVPEWMEDKNGLWTHDILAIPDLTANFVQAWLEDMSPNELYEKMAEIKEKYTEIEQVDKLKEVYEGLVNERITEFEQHLPKEEVVENNTEEKE